MQDIPAGTHSSVTPAAWIVISKTINNSVPHWRKPGNQKRFAKWYPNVIDHKKTTMKFENIQVFGGPDAFRVLGKAAVQRLSRCVSLRAATFSGSCMNGFPNINWSGELVVPVPICQLSVCGKSP